MKSPSPACKLLARELRYKRSYFSKNCLLHSDGSFYYDDNRLSIELGISTKTIMRCKRTLRELGEIEYEAGKFKGSATKYWILNKTDKTSLFPHLKTDNNSHKGDNHISNDCHIVSPNLSNNQLINNFGERMNEEGLKEMHEGLQKWLDRH